MIVLLLTGAGCRPAESKRSVPQVVRTSDANGVPMVLVSTTKGLDLPLLPTRQIFHSERAGSSLSLFQVSAAVFLADSSLALANSGRSEILVLSTEGKLLERWGRNGQGPGEFRSINGLMLDGVGALVAYDPMLARLSRFKSGSGFVGSERLMNDPIASLIPLLAADGGVLISVTGEQRVFLPEGSRRDTVPLLAVRSGESSDTLAIWLGAEKSFVRAGRRSIMVPVGYSPSFYHASNGDRAALGSSDSVDVYVLSREGKIVLRIAANATHDPLPEGAVEAWQKLLASTVSSNASPELREAWASAPVRSPLPGFDGLGLSPEGYVWLGSYVMPGADEREWLVFDREGIPMGRVVLPRLPAGPLPGSTELLAVGPGRVAILRRNRLDEETVEVWEVSYKNQY